MGSPAVLQADHITGTCATHLVPNPSSGAPQPAPPMPFSAPLTQGLSATVRIAGKPAAVVGSSGLNTPPHVGLHATDPFFTPSIQVGRIVSGSATVRIGGLPAASSSSSVTCCSTGGTVVGTAATVLVG